MEVRFVQNCLFFAFGGLRFSILFCEFFEKCNILLEDKKRSQVWFSCNVCNAVNISCFSLALWVLPVASVATRPFSTTSASTRSAVQSFDRPCALWRRHAVGHVWSPRGQDVVHRFRLVPYFRRRQEVSYQVKILNDDRAQGRLRSAHFSPIRNAQLFSEVLNEESIERASDVRSPLHENKNRRQWLAASQPADKIFGGGGMIVCNWVVKMKMLVTSYCTKQTNIFQNFRGVG